MSSHLYSQHVSRRERKKRKKQAAFQIPIVFKVFLGKTSGDWGCCTHHCEPSTPLRGLISRKPKQLHLFFSLTCEAPASMWRFMYYHSSEHQRKSGVGGAGVGSAGSEGKHKTHTFSRHKRCTNPPGSGGWECSRNGELILLGNGSLQSRTSIGSGPCVRTRRWRRVTTDEFRCAFHMRGWTWKKHHIGLEVSVPLRCCTVRARVRLSTREDWAFLHATIATSWVITRQVYSGNLCALKHNSPSQVGRLPLNKSGRYPFFPCSPGASFQKSIQDVNDCLPRVYPNISHRCIAPMQGCVYEALWPN